MLGKHIFEPRRTYRNGPHRAQILGKLGEGSFFNVYAAEILNGPLLDRIPIEDGQVIAAIKLLRRKFVAGEPFFEMQTSLEFHTDEEREHIPGFERVHDGVINRERGWIITSIFKKYLTLASVFNIWRHQYGNLFQLHGPPNKDQSEYIRILLEIAISILEKIKQAQEAGLSIPDLKSTNAMCAMQGEKPAESSVIRPIRTVIIDTLDMLPIDHPISRAPSIFGSAHTMSPEVTKRRGQHLNSPIYSLAAMLLQMIPYDIASKISPALFLTDHSSMLHRKEVDRFVNFEAFARARRMLIKVCPDMEKEIDLLLEIIENGLQTKPEARMNAEQMQSVILDRFGNPYPHLGYDTH